MNCIDVARDAVWIGKDCVVPCVNVELCKAEGCYWRKFHGLRSDQFYLRGPQGEAALTSLPRLPCTSEVADVAPKGIAIESPASVRAGVLDLG